MRKASLPQSLSLSLVAGGQQRPSPFVAATAWVVQAAWQVPAPVRTAAVQRSTSVSGHDVGQAPAPERIAVSQVSPGSTTPLPQRLVIASGAPTGASGISIGAS